MKITLRSLVAVVAFIIAASLPSFAEKAGPFGAGLILGTDTGFSFAYRLNKVNTIQSSLAWSMIDSSGVSVTADYLFHFDDIFTIDDVTIPVYAGVGGKSFLPFSKDSDFGLGIRIPLGARWLFKQYPIEAFAEIVPGMKVIPKTSPMLGFGIGARWYF